jgi:hypothetical protein
MVRQSLGNLEEHVYYILFISILVVIFWFCVWELVTEVAEYIHRRYYIPKWKISMIGLIIVILCIELFPQILKKI